MQMLQARNPGHSLRFSVPPSSPPPGCRTNSVHQQCCTTHDISYDRAAALVFFSFFLSFFCLHTFVSLADRDSYTFRLLTHTPLPSTRQYVYTRAAATWVFSSHYVRLQKSSDRLSPASAA